MMTFRNSGCSTRGRCALRATLGAMLVVVAVVGGAAAQDADEPGVPLDTADDTQVLPASDGTHATRGIAVWRTTRGAFGAELTALADDGGLLAQFAIHVAESGSGEFEIVATQPGAGSQVRDFSNGAVSGDLEPTLSAIFDDFLSDVLAQSEGQASDVQALNLCPPYQGECWNGHTPVLDPPLPHPGLPIVRCADTCDSEANFADCQSIAKVCHTYADCEDGSYRICDTYACGLCL